MRHPRGVFICLTTCISLALIGLFNQSPFAQAATEQNNTLSDSVALSAPSRLQALSLSQTTQLTDTTTTTETETSAEPTLLDTIIEATANDEDNADDSGADDLYSEAIEGTVFANRTPASVTFFVEGELYRLAPLRSLGINLQRSPASINMFNCDADTPESESTCRWDPYLVNSEGFYEVFNTAPDGLPVQLVLQDAGEPPADRIWIQNRTGQREILIFEGSLYEVPPAKVQVFEVDADSSVTFYRRSCIQIEDESVCEWIPQQIDSGFYYSLNETTVAGRLADSKSNTAEIRPILAQDGNVIEQPRQILCQLQVPRLNVRSGPGLNYLIVTTISSDTGTSGSRVAAIGRDENGQWIAVDQSIALGGWVTSSRQLIACDGDISSLPITEITDGRLVPTPVPAPTRAPAAPTPPPVAVQPVPQNPAQSPDLPLPDDIGEEPLPEELDPLPEEIDIPPGKLKLVIQNVFEHEVRFTLSPDEFDIQPGETITLIRDPGRFTFTVSSPWRGLSGNAEVTLDGNQSFSMYLYFIPKPGKSDEWEMKYQ